MSDLKIEELKRACVVIGEGLQRVAEEFRALADAYEIASAAEALGVNLSRVWKECERDAIEALARVMNESGGDIAMEALQELAEMVEDMPPIIHKKILRPPKRLGPVNKANYAANRPLRMARSNCRNIKH